MGALEIRISSAVCAGVWRHSTWLQAHCARLPRYACTLTAPGARRPTPVPFHFQPSSIKLGLDAVPPETDVVIVHDMVRPFVDAATLGRVALAAHEHKAGWLAQGS